jgi:hypothetical protein
MAWEREIYRTVSSRVGDDVAFQASPVTTRGEPKPPAVVKAWALLRFRWRPRSR